MRMLRVIMIDIDRLRRNHVTNVFGSLLYIVVLKLEIVGAK